ncbi:FecR family protein [Parabacteroides sp. AM58-2XD]|uniref:FecR family protein n=1 Tax=Parabacteroides TaxID=375288 RepID=UPI000FE1C601|nr:MULTISPECIES: FecR domain-containing protein [Parabacteroides]RGZ02899.1 FecR family protein [Parabacteroides sp. AM58-2XD]GKG72989.1 anti-sigma factor [Parabacteroides goldsteinii]GKG78924.1 anti-sigma factor [Parabacteroides goldsteinii]
MENEHTELIIGYLQNNLTQEETDCFYNWVNESASNKELFFEIKAMYDAGLPLSTPWETSESWERLLNKKKNSQSRRFNLWYQISTYAAVALLAVAISSMYFLFFHEEDNSLYSKYIGGDGLEADVVELPDGTHISLGSKTTFHYDKDYGKDKRIVYLEGEAYFDVAKQKDKPFIVKTKEQDIEALGTKFNVMAYPLDSLVVTTLSEGSVRLTSLNMAHPTILKPDQQLIYNRNTKKSYLQDVDAQQYSSWTSGYYYFPQQSLQAILDRLSHVYGIQFTVNSEALNKRTFTGTFYRGQSIKDIMDIINLSIPIRYKIDDHHVTISEK